MKRIFCKKYLISLLVLCIGLLSTLVTVQAAANQQTLKAKTTYTTTLTGSQKHKVRYTTTVVNSDNVALNLYIDGKKIRTWKKQDVFGWNIRLINVSSGRKLFCITDKAINGYNNYIGIYEYKNKKLTLLSNLASITRNTAKSTNKQLTPWARGTLLKVRKNALTVRWRDSTPATGYYYQDIIYKISGNKITKTGSTYTLMGPDKSKPVKWTATRTINAYQGIGNGEKVFTVKAGENVTGLKVSSRMGSVFFYLKNSKGEAGWFCASDIKSGSCFKEAKFAG